VSVSKKLLTTQSRSLVDLAHEEINRRIATGLLPKGSRVVIGALAREFGMSLIPVREALAKLHAERLVTFEANKGYRVSAPPDKDELQELFGARLAMELGSLELSIRYVTPEIVEQLREMNAEMARKTYGTSFDLYIDFVHLNAAFHEKLLGLSGNSFLIDAYRRLGYQVRITQTLHGRGVPDIERLVSEHTRIIDAVSERSYERAHQALRTHIVGGAQRLGALLDLPVD
jgi:DNA-binding GntR family transcriptional regulator